MDVLNIFYTWYNILIYNIIFVLLSYRATLLPANRWHPCTSRRTLRLCKRHQQRASYVNVQPALQDGRHDAEVAAEARTSFNNITSKQQPAEPRLLGGAEQVKQRGNTRLSSLFVSSCSCWASVGLPSWEANDSSMLRPGLLIKTVSA